MTHQELLRASPCVEPGKREQRAWQVRGLFAVVAVIAITATLTFWHPGGHPGGDPGGVRLQMLRSIAVVLPGDAKVQLQRVGEPIWSSCDGHSETGGWGDVTNTYEFTSASSAATVFAGAEAKMKIAGWNRGLDRDVKPSGPSVVWSKTVSGNVVATARLGLFNRAPGSHGPSIWDLWTSAVPAGTRASGC